MVQAATASEETPQKTGDPPPPLLRSFVVKEPVFGGNAHVVEGGTENPVSLVLVHGLGDLASDTWRLVLPELIRHYHVIAFDLPGFGRSDKLNAHYSPARYAEFVRWVTTQYVPGPFTLAGHSLGATVALHYAARFPQNLEKLVLISAAGILQPAALARELTEGPLQGFGSPEISALLRNSIRILPQLPIEPNRLLENALLREQVLGGDPSRIAALALLGDQVGTLLPQVRTPAVILWGAEDAITPLRTGILLKSVLPRSRLQIIPGAGHMPMFDQPRAFGQALLQAVAGPAPEPPPIRGAPGGPVVRFEGERGKVVRGDFAHLEIVGCREMRLIDVTAHSINIVNSMVSFEGGVIRGKETGLRIAGGEVSATGLRVEAKTALFVSNSYLDLAGVHLDGFEAAVLSEGGAEVLFSASRVRSPYTAGYLNGLRRLSPGSPL